MKYPTLYLLPVALLTTVAFTLKPQTTAPAKAVAVSVDRSPEDVVLTPDGTHALTANRTAHTVSLVHLSTGKVVQEVHVGKEPFALAISKDGAGALVTNYASGSVTLLRVGGDTVTAEATIPVGDQPRGVALTPDGKRAYVALSGTSEVAVIDVATRKVTRHWKTDDEPWHMALTPDADRLVVACTRGRTVQVFEAKTGQLAHSVNILGHNLRRIAVSADGNFAYFPGIGERGMGTLPEHIDRGWVISNRLVRAVVNGGGPREAITLDTRSNAVGDVDGCALSPDGKTIALTAGGTHELLLLADAPKLPYEGYGGPGDHIDGFSRQRLRRVDLGGKPTGVRFTPDGTTAIVANYFGNCLQVVDVTSGKLTRTIPLGSAATVSQARQGEMLFNDAKRSFGSWYSCNSCHTEGHTNGSKFDTQNDGSFGRPKKVLSLRGVTETGPWTWHGWRKDLREAIHDSFTSSMQGPEPTKAEVEAVYAYLKTLMPPKSPYPTTATTERGAKIFTAKGCDSCHAGVNFTTNTVSAVGMEDKSDAYKGYNPPSLRGVYARAPFLHDGRAATLEEVLTEWHTPAKLTGKPNCTEAELKDLVAYLQTL